MYSYFDENHKCSLVHVLDFYIPCVFVIQEINITDSSPQVDISGYENLNCNVALKMKI